MTSLRVAYVVNMFPKLSETFIAEELAELDRRGVDVRVLSLKEPRDPVQHAVVTASGLLARTWYEQAAFLDALRVDRPHLVHAHFATEPTRVARAIARDLGVPYSFTAHGYDVYRKPPVDLAGRARDAAAVLTVSQANADHLVRACDLPRERITVLPCGVDLTRFQPPSEQAESRTVVAVARLRPVKNLGQLLRASAVLRDRQVAHRVVIIGDGPCRAELEAERRALDLEQVVHFAGPLDQDGVRSWWQRATVGVLTSSSEGMPVSLMEAAACGVPVVAPAVGGIPELVVNGVTGLVVPAGDVEACADALQAVLVDPALRQRMSVAAASRALACFGVSQQVDTLLSVWSQPGLRVVA